MIASTGPKLSWNKRKIERANTKAMKELERGMKDRAQKEKQVYIYICIYKSIMINTERKIYSHCITLWVKYGLFIFVDCIG